MDGREQSPESSATFSAHVDKSAWTIHSVSSNQGGNEDVKFCIDDDPNTFWHTKYNPTDKCPHELIVDMKKTYTVKQFVYQARNDMPNGHIANVEVLFSNDPNQWGEPAVKCRLQNHSNEQLVDVPSHPSARYMKVVVRSTHDRNDYATAAEVGIIPQ